MFGSKKLVDPTIMSALLRRSLKALTSPTARGVASRGLWGLGGTALAAAENKYLGDLLPEELKKVNLGVGFTTGLLARNRRHRGKALGSLPFKQLGLFGVGEAAQARRERSGLMNLDLDRARTELATARTNQQGAEGRALREQAGIDTEKARNWILGILGGGAVLGGGALAYDALSADRKTPRRRASTARVGEKGRTSRTPDKLRVRIDVPTASAPPELINSLINLDDNRRARTVYETKSAAVLKTLLGKKLLGLGAAGGVGYGGYRMAQSPGAGAKPPGILDQGRNWLQDLSGGQSVGNVLAKTPRMFGGLLGYQPWQQNLQSWYDYAT